MTTGPDRRYDLHDKIEKKKKGVKVPHWYWTWTDECVICGYTAVTKERRYDPPPENDADRYEHTQFACPDHFL